MSCVFNVFISVFPGRRDTLLCGENAVSYSTLECFVCMNILEVKSVIQDE